MKLVESLLFFIAHIKYIYTRSSRSEQPIIIAIVHFANTPMYTRTEYNLTPNFSTLGHRTEKKTMSVSVFHFHANTPCFVQPSIMRQTRIQFFHSLNLLQSLSYPGNIPNEIFCFNYSRINPSVETSFVQFAPDALNFVLSVISNQESSTFVTAYANVDGDRLNFPDVTYT